MGDDNPAGLATPSGSGPAERRDDSSRQPLARSCLRENRMQMATNGAERAREGQQFLRSVQGVRLQRACPVQPCRRKAAEAAHHKGGRQSEMERYRVDELISSTVSPAPGCVSRTRREWQSILLGAVRKQRVARLPHVSEATGCNVDLLLTSASAQIGLGVTAQSSDCRDNLVAWLRQLA